jgi:hypothetical protein
MWVSVGMACAGCSSDARLKQLAAKEIGCSMEDVTVEDIGGREGAKTWMALCDGQKFFCDEGTDGVMCAEEVEKEAEPAAEPEAAEPESAPSD